MTSREKVEAALQGMVVEEPSEEAHPVELALRGMVQFAGGHIAAALEAYEDELDELIVQAAEWMLEKRSDDAPPLALTARRPQLPAGP